MNRVSRRAVLAAGAAAAGGLGLAGQLAAAPRRPDTTSVPLVGEHRVLPGGRTYVLSGSGPRLVLGAPGSNLAATTLNNAAWDTGNAATSGWQRHAADHGYVLALLEPAAPAANSSWNVGGGWPSGGQDDMAYLADVVADATAAHSPFEAHFIAGFSAGGALAWRAACQRPDLFAAAGVASGWGCCPAPGPVDVHWTHGGADTTVPVRGGLVPVFPYTFPAAWQTFGAAARGSRVVPEFLPDMGHAMPGWVAGRWWDFFTTGRLLP